MKKLFVHLMVLAVPLIIKAEPAAKMNIVCQMKTCGSTIMNTLKPKITAKVTFAVWRSS